MALIIIENLRGFFNSRPPLVVFMICLASFAIALITFAYIVKTKDMPNPDLTEDWNTLLGNFADLHFCFSQDAGHHNTTHSSDVKLGELSQGDVVEEIKDNLLKGKKSGNDKRFVREVDVQPTHEAPSVGKDKTEAHSTDVGTSTVNTSPPSTHRDAIVNLTIDIDFGVTPSRELFLLPLSSVRFIAEITGNMLKMKGSKRDQRLVISWNFPHNLTQSDCEEMDRGVCTSYVIKACVTFSGPGFMLPRVYPRRFAESSTCQNPADAAADSVLRNVTSATSSVSSSKPWCSHGAKMQAAFTLDDSLTIFLSQEERSVINLHLMRTSYFLFVMVVTLFCYAMVKGRPGKVKNVVHIPYEKVSSNA